MVIFWNYTDSMGCENVIIVGIHLKIHRLVMGYFMG